MSIKVLKDKKLKRIFTVVLFFLAFFVIAFYFRSLFVVAIVDSRPITRFAFDRILERQAGKQVLENEISKILVLQEAKKQKVDISPQEVEEKIKELEQQFETQGMNLDNLLQTQGQTRKDLNQQIEVQLMIEKILGKDIQVSEEEVKKYYEENKNFYPKDSTFESLKDKVKEELFRQKIGEKFQTWLEELRGKAKIYYLLQL